MKSILLAGSLLFGGWFGVNASDMEFKPRPVDTPVVEVNEFHAYINELLEDYDVADLTEDQVAVLQAEINALVQAKADELGITLDADHDVFNQWMNRELMGEIVAYGKELIATYDFSTMTEEEIAEAKVEIQGLLEAKALELGVTLPENGLGFIKAPRGNSINRAGAQARRDAAGRGGMNDGDCPIPDVDESATTTSTNSL
jgi:hypothetical protein